MNRMLNTGILVLLAVGLAGLAGGQDLDEYEWQYQDNKPGYGSRDGFDENEQQDRYDPGDYYHYDYWDDNYDNGGAYEDYGNIRMYDDETYGLFDEADYPEWYDFEEDAGDLREEYEWRAFGDFVEDPEYQDYDEPYGRYDYGRYTRDAYEADDYYRAFGRNLYRDAPARKDETVYIEEYNEYDFGGDESEAGNALAEWLGENDWDDASPTWSDNSEFYEN